MRDLNPELRVFCLQSMATTNPVLRGNERKEFIDYLDEFPSIQTLESVICFRKVYRDCMSSGLGVLETDNTAAKSEMEKLMEEVFG
ncbi:peptide transporter (plasmid) [Edwardsiella tarda]|nr:peptide transporter [Edwardsiella tarda]